jgi:glycosyltransferase involved in cell wall biosynthesis
VNADKIVVVHERLYHWRYNDKSITGREWDSQIFDVFEIWNRIAKFLIENTFYEDWKILYIRHKLENIYHWYYQCTSIKLRLKFQELILKNITNDDKVFYYKEFKYSCEKNDKQFYEGVVSSVKVSIIIPIYNAEQYLQKCLDSVVNQTLKDIQIICINDGSTDNSLNILKNFATRDSRIIIIDQSHAGGDVSRNPAYFYIKGKYTLFVDADDWIEPDTCKKIFAKAEETNAQIIMFFADGPKWLDWCQSKVKTDMDGIVTEKTSALELFCVWNKLWLSAFLTNNKLFFPDGAGSDAFVTWKGIALATKIAVVTKKFYHYRIVSTSLCNRSGVHHINRLINFNRIYNFLYEADSYMEYRDFFLAKKLEVYERYYNLVFDKKNYHKIFIDSLNDDMKEFYRFFSINNPNIKTITNITEE